MNFKIGDKAIIARQLNGHQFDIGTVVTITSIHETDDPPYYDARGRGGEWAVEDNELEPVPTPEAGAVLYSATDGFKL